MELTRMKYKIVFDADKCVACNACSIACIDQNDIDVAKGEKPHRRVFTEEVLSQSHLKLIYVMESCQHCLNAPCAELCPLECIKIDEDTGFVVYDDAECIGCGLCEEACQYNAISFSTDGKVRKCDGCYIRVKHKMEPACVRNCPTEALKLCKSEWKKPNG